MTEDEILEIEQEASRAYSGEEWPAVAISRLIAALREAIVERDKATDDLEWLQHDRN